ncbi:arylsulfatase [Mariniblastus fucicola]|uniref:Arylsulfatase n=1 Tax=Mariniblastus fucicola TaxID=980251 RepID=A0A5B9PDW7_9BACT|nr:arylsulfatase [Mariniblastus fucicola]QEG22766.1 Arylsulfatase precursor [Mariniblastus fucicola]
MRSLSKLVSVFLLLLLFNPALAEDPATPNIVVVITDDQGHGDLSCHGNPVLKTPNIDALAADSIRLTDFHVSPTCSPSRAAFMTGRCSNRTGVWHTIMGRSLLRENEITIAELLRDSGYATGMFGKWHLGDNAPFRPEDRGFTEVYRHSGGGVGQTPDYWDNAYFDGHYLHNGKFVPADGFCTDVFFRHAKNFIRDQAEQKKPFFAWISTNAPHGPLHCPVKWSEPYKDQGKGVSNFLGMIANIDSNVGELRELLDQLGVAQNTIFIFTTDNGTAGGRKIHNSGMRGQKGSEYDGGHRVPCFVHWPGNFTGGVDLDPLTAHVDLLPTLAEICHVKLPTDVKLDGESIVPLLRDPDNTDAKWNERVIVTDSQRVLDPIKWRKSSVMTSQWRLINGKELYDIDADPGQSTDISAAHPDVVQTLTKAYDSWWADIEPTFAQFARIHIGSPDENPTVLTAHDWLDAAPPWNQAHIRGAKPSAPGYWSVNVLQPGNYRVALRRFPAESDFAIDQQIPNADPVPGTKAYRDNPGTKIDPVKASLTIGDDSQTIDFESGSKEVSFDVELEAGETTISASFETADGEQVGAFYVYVTRK